MHIHISRRPDRRAAPDKSTTVPPDRRPFSDDAALLWFTIYSVWCGMAPYKTYTDA